MKTLLRTTLALGVFLSAVGARRRTGRARSGSRGESGAGTGGKHHHDRAPDYHSAPAPAGSTRHQHVRNVERTRRRIQGLPGRFRRRLCGAVSVAAARERGRAERGERRQREPADRDRQRLQQLDGESVSACAARGWHPRAADVVSVVPPSQRDVGQGRLHSDGQVAHPAATAREPDEVRHAEGWALRDQLR